MYDFRWLAVVRGFSVRNNVRIEWRIIYVLNIPVLRWQVATHPTDCL